MSPEPESDLELEIAHVLLIDVVGYSKLLVNEQIELLQILNRIVRETPHFAAAEAAGKLKRIPTGDGMALLFFDSAESPVKCALEISQAVQNQPTVTLRMGAHSGPIRTVMDVNDRSNFAGAGINMAQRVLDCGDGGHILLSERIADDLRFYRHWHSCLHDLGVCEVKHGVRVHLFNLCKDGLGNPAIPEMVRRQHRRIQRLRTSTTHWVAGSRRRKAMLIAAYCAVGIAIVAACWLGWRQSSSPPSLGRSIAVLPFGNLSDEKDSFYFVDGVHEEILTDLSKVADLKVISRTSVMQYKPGVERNLRQIGRALGVSHVLEGNVQRVGNRVRVHAQLIDARTDAHVWANRYDRELADVFAMQSEIAGEIAAQLEARLSAKEKAALEDRPTNDLAAYDLYAHAKWLIDNASDSPRGKEDLDEAVKLLTEAISRDPQFFLAYYRLAHAHDQIFLRYGRSPDQLALAASAIEALQRLRPDSGEAHLALAKHVYWGYLDYNRARKELEIARSALPNDAVPPLLTGYIDRREGRWPQAVANLLRALELDPRNSLILEQLSRAYSSLRRYPEMAAMLDRAVSLSPSDAIMRAKRATVELDWRADTKPLHTTIEAILSANPSVAAAIAPHWFYLSLHERDHANAAKALAFLGPDGCQGEAAPFPNSWCEGVVARLGGDEAAAQAAFQKARAEAGKLFIEQPEYGGAACALAMAEAAVGNKAEAIGLGRRAVELLPVSKDAVDGTLLAESLAIIYAWTGETDLAIQQLEFLTKNPGYLSYGNLRLHPDWDPLRGDPRFEQIVESMAPK